ncbi:hypothetical protein CPT_Machias_050 [Staphylococcus phage Machias]|nr:hypothetical protein CPT_Machias_050 [Staphylococcus phage Machias]
MVLNKKSFIVTFHATLVVKGLLELEEVSEGNGLKSLVEEVLNEIGFGEKENNDDWTTASIQSSNLVLPKSLPDYEYSDEEPIPSKPENTPVEAEIDPIEEEHRVEGFNEDSEVQGIGRATEVEPQEDSENENSARGGILPQ